ncbi:hypothetical protein Glove_185g26 [Diversispora epigaea]|uniref:Uncharacterized protein n=1 Tax=Diversispora epigaea TaxID=1348612 RepID=A0A397IMG4_9GLOM|nr:hypothetical protein Glove_185g26 [Diversispora epigaea]
MPVLKLINAATKSPPYMIKISTWIDKKESPYFENNPYVFEFLLEDLEMVEGMGEILGGYNPLKLDNNQNRQKQTNDSICMACSTYPKPIRLDEFVSPKVCLPSDVSRICMACSTYPKPIRLDEFVSPKVCLPSDVSREFLFSVEEIVNVLNNKTIRKVSNL